MTYKTAWYMTTRIRRAIRNASFGVKLEGIVEADIGVIKTDGGQSTRSGHITPGTNVLGMVSRDSGALQMQILQSLKKREIERVCLANFGAVRRLYTDASYAFNLLPFHTSLQQVTHAKE